MTKIEISSKFIKVIGAKATVRYDAGPWIDGIPADMIKIRPRKNSFPQEFKAAFAVENKSDSREDYFEADTIRVYRNHPLYAQIKAFA